MKNFDHINAESIASAVKLIGANHSLPISGGTDLLPALKQKILEADTLVNLKTIPDLDYIHFDDENGLRLGALATLDDMAASEIIHKQYPILYKSISVTASPQLRNRGTIGGNLNQHSRCRYYRGAFNCWLKGGNICYAKNGENARHALFGSGPCCTVHPSDPAPALIALYAEVQITGTRGERTLPLEKFFQSPRRDSRQLTVLRSGELVSEIRVPPPQRNNRGTYIKAMERQAWAFALVSLAAQITFSGNKVKDPQLILGGVAPLPWRLKQVEELLQGKPLDEPTISRAAELAVSGASPLSQNAYKIGLIKGLITVGLNELKGA